MEEIEWARPFYFEQCPARLEPNIQGYWGRCERKRLHKGPHALDRGADILLFETTIIYYPIVRG